MNNLGIRWGRFWRRTKTGAQVHPTPVAIVHRHQGYDIEAGDDLKA